MKMMRRKLNGERARKIEWERSLISHTLGVPVAPHNTFVAVAERLRQRESH